MVTHNKNDEFTGFIGNRMFQTASTIGIAVKHDMPYSFSQSEYLSVFKNVPCRPNHEFHNFSLIDVPEYSFCYQTVNLSKVNKYNILGYRQTEKYFDHCKDLIKTTFQFKDPIVDECNSIISDLRKIYPGKKLISVHVRCGDYLNLKNHHTCLMDVGYYGKALEEFDFAESVFIVFSDDKTVAFNFFASLHSGKITYQLSVGTKPVIDMCLMSMMDGHIIANSSFSWWGAWLSGNKTISPSKNKWFGSAYKDMETKDIIPDSWKQIE